MSEHETRRQFLKQAAVAGAVAAAGCHNGKNEEHNKHEMKSHPATSPATMPTAMNKLNVAGIGVMGKGESDLAGISKSKDVNIVALCEYIWNGAIGDVTEVHCWTNRPIWPQGLDRPEGEDPVPPNLHWNEWLGPAKCRPFKLNHVVEKDKDGKPILDENGKEKIKL